MKETNIVITGVGSYIPKVVVLNSDFVNTRFYDKNRQFIDEDSESIIEKFRSITGIEERRYANNDLNSSDIAAIAARRAIEDAGIDAESIDQIILAHNFGDVRKNTIQSDAVPSLAARVKYLLGIENPACVAYDILFGCPGWLQGMIQAEAFIKSGMAKRCLVIGSETLSRVVDEHDRDSMIFSDGAGAAIVEAVESEQKSGILASAVVSDTKNEVYYLYMGDSNIPDADPKVRYIKMLGRKIYEYSLANVPKAMKMALEKSGLEIADVNKILIHQANEKMDDAIVKRFYRLYKEKVPEDVMPMSIKYLGNSSVATIPTLYDLIRRKALGDHLLKRGDIVLFASVGAGMNINAIVYKEA